MQQTTFQAVLLKGLRRFAELPAVTLLPSEETITYRELLEKIELVSTYLHNLGARRGTHIATLISNSLEAVIFGLAVQRLGATLVPLGEKLGPREVGFILREAKPKLVIMATKPHVTTILEYLEEANDPNVHVIGLPGFGVDYPEKFMIFEWPVEKKDLDFPVSEGEDIALLSYTGGTTGTPKGVMHSQAGLAAGILSAAIEDPIDDRDRLLLSTPIVHAGGSLLWRALISGVHVYVMRAFDAEYFIKAIKKYQITTTFMVPTMLYRLLDQVKIMEYDVSSMRSIFYGASPISPKQLKEAFEVFGPIMRQQYGMTECNIVISRLSKSAHVWAYHNNQEVLKSCGKPCLFTEVRVIDDNGQDVGQNEMGEIIVKSPSMLVGYYQRPEQTQEAIRDGWFYTGDIGKWDEYGYLYIVDRKKDMIISGGMNVYSSEVERVVNQHPAVAMSACIGVPHPDWGEAVCVVVSGRAGSSCTEEDIIQFCKERTSKYMVPKVVYFQEQFPLTPIGKIDKKELKKMYAQGLLTI
ncbi:class I adenylate-forming enzyme family protein [Neobacillus rhizophilus]|uniref:AMP-binding protein n=1 Tax=Neobacillus rhizophilus TaxID=2833579 RepID=A0A942YU61_9BACI|nr:AMP-binding protein [Neobacillus rhizophilus]MBS4211620.1 AMP-binding protein [Neobacillus rhizophilus]MBU8917025.1 AMP-binding protein [Bacillus sp. FJAT-29953]